MSVFPSKELILEIINYGVESKYLWSLKEILAVDLQEQSQRAIVLMYQSGDFQLYIYDLAFEKEEWVIKHLIPLAWEFTKIGYSLFLSDEVKYMINPPSVDEVM